MRSSWRVACVLLLLGTLASPLRAAPPEPQQAPLPAAEIKAPAASPTPVPLELRAKIDPLALQQAETQGQATFLVYLKEQANPADGIPAQAGKSERRARAYDALTSIAARSQQPVVEALTALQANGQVRDYRSFWIVNALAVTGNRDALLSLAARPDVASVQANRRYQLTWPAADASSSAPSAGSASSAVGSASSAVASAVLWNLAQIRVDVAQEAFDVDGSGVVIANVDSGVDWTHPALQTQYRGYNAANPAASSHDHNWYDLTGTYPNAPGPNTAHLTAASDHGTLTMGTVLGMEADGSNRTGVAPGAKWIAVKAIREDGSTDAATLHAAFQWILAPTDLKGNNPDPSLAPDIVSNSWDWAAAGDTTFLADIQAWRAAGIVPVFAAGNDGPSLGSIDSPASLSQVIAVGSSDEKDAVSDTSGRGPSPFQDIKPEVVAPGTSIRSTIAGGSYETKSGTSMAAPHVAGLLALVYQAAAGAKSTDWPPLSYAQVTRIITSTAVDLAPLGPDPASGWGRIDAYQAVGAAANGGAFRGRVTDAQTHAALAGATVTMVNRQFGGVTHATTNANGEYTFTVAAGQYDVTASHFYYASSTAAVVDIVADTTTQLDLGLQPLPTGTLRGQVTEAGSGKPVTATISVSGTAISVATDAQGSYNLRLPAGVRDLRVWPNATGHRGVTQSGIAVQAGVTTTANYGLTVAPRILLVDGNSWGGSTEAAHLQIDLTALLYPYDSWRIEQYPKDNPSAATLGRYTLVIWSQAESSPGYVGAWTALRTYLQQGGALLLSGQDIGYWDSYQGYGADAYANLLHARYVANDSGSRRVEGIAGGPFAGLSLVLNATDTAANQSAPSEIAANDALAQPVLAYTGDGVAALAAEGCGSRVLYLAFGLGGAGDRATRRRALDQGIGYLAGTRPAQGFNTFQEQVSVSARPGTQARHNVSVANLGQSSASYDVEVASTTWPASVLNAAESAPLSQTAALAPCASASLVVHVDVPTNAVPGQQGQTVLRIFQHGDPASARQVTLTTLVLPVWSTAPSLPAARQRHGAAALGCQVYVAGGLDSAGNALSSCLRLDPGAGSWTAVADLPTPVSSVTLVAANSHLYAIGGYVNLIQATDLVQVYDPATNRWSVETHLPKAVGGAAAAALDGVLYVFGGLGTEGTYDTVWGYNLATGTWQTYAPMPGGPRSYAGATAFGAAIYVAGGWPALRTVERYDPRTNTWTSLCPLNDGRQGAVVATAGGRVVVAGGGDTSAGFDSVEVYDQALNRWLSAPPLIVNDRAGAAGAVAAGRLFVTGGKGLQLSYTCESWLVDTSLAGSTLYAGPDPVQPGQQLTYMLVLRNPGVLPIQQAQATCPIPPATTYVANSATGGLAWDPAHNRLSWQGSVGARSSVVLTYAVTVDPAATNGQVITGTATLAGDPCQTVTVTDASPVADADLRTSRMEVQPAHALPGNELTYTFRLINTGPVAAPNAVLSDTLPAGVELVAGSLSTGAQYSAATRRVTWNGDLGAASGRVGSIADSDGGGVTFGWVDASQGTLLPMLDDDSKGPLPLGFSFRFFDGVYDSFYVNSNGQVLFGAGSRAFSNTIIPTTGEPNNFIAAFWDDLTPNKNGSVRYQTFGSAPHRYTVVQWTDVPNYADANARLTFQVVIREENNEIWLQYLTLTGNGAAGESATVGVENATGTDGTQYLFQGMPQYAALHDHLAIRILTPLPLQPVQQVVSFRAQVAAGVAPNTLITNTATLSAGGHVYPLTGTAAIATVDLSTSTLAVSPAEPVLSGDTLSYTIQLHNTGNYGAQQAQFEVPLPAQTEFVAGSASGGITYQDATHRLTWTGALGAGQNKSLTFALRTSPLAPPATVVTTTAVLHDGYGQTWNRSVASNLLGSALAGSEFVANTARALAGQVVTYTARIHNIGPAAQVRMTNTLPTELTLVPESLWASTGAPVLQNGVVTWAGQVPADGLVIVRYRARWNQAATDGVRNNTASLDDGHVVVQRTAQVDVARVRGVVILPLILK